MEGRRRHLETQEGDLRFINGHAEYQDHRRRKKCEDKETMEKRRSENYLQELPKG